MKSIDAIYRIRTLCAATLSLTRSEDAKIVMEQIDEVVLEWRRNHERADKE